jgi:hypothetical protein
MQKAPADNALPHDGTGPDNLAPDDHGRGGRLPAGQGTHDLRDGRAADDSLQPGDRQAAVPPPADRRLAGGADRTARQRDRPPPPIYAGSNDPLLEWALRQSGSGLAVLAAGRCTGWRNWPRGARCWPDATCSIPKAARLEPRGGEGAPARRVACADPLGAAHAGADHRAGQSAGHNRAQAMPPPAACALPCGPRVRVAAPAGCAAGARGADGRLPCRRRAPPKPMPTLPR